MILNDSVLDVFIAPSNAKTPSQPQNVLVNGHGPQYDIVELKPVSKQSSSLQDNDITVTTNEAYGELKPIYM